MCDPFLGRQDEAEHAIEQCDHDRGGREQSAEESWHAQFVFEERHYGREQQREQQRNEQGHDDFLAEIAHQQARENEQHDQAAFDTAHVDAAARGLPPDSFRPVIGRSGLRSRFAEDIFYGHGAIPFDRHRKMPTPAVQEPALLRHVRHELG